MDEKQKNNEKNNKKQYILLAVLAFLIILLAVAIYFLFTNGDNAEEKELRSKPGIKALATNITVKQTINATNGITFFPNFFFPLKIIISQMRAYATQIPYKKYVAMPVE